MNSGPASGRDRHEQGQDPRAHPASTILAGVLALALALLASGYEVYLRWHGREVPAGPAVARRLQALERVKALTGTTGQEARACLPFNRQTEARMILDDLLGKAEVLTDGDFATLDAARRAFDDPARSRAPGARSQDAWAFLAACRRVSEGH